MCRDAAQLSDGTGCCNRDTLKPEVCTRRPGRVVATFWPTCGLLFTRYERGLLMRDTMDGALFWWMGALATGIVVAAAALMS
jgi:hypothetical protein